MPPGRFRSPRTAKSIGTNRALLLCLRSPRIAALALFLFVLFSFRAINNLPASVSPEDQDANLLKSLGVPVGIELARDLDKMYGRDIFIDGIDRCERFRSSVPAKDRFVSAAGMYNTGTHVIFSYLDKYCELPGKDQTKVKNARDKLRKDAKIQEVMDSGILFETYWGKHKHVTDRGNVVTLPKYEGMPVDNLLPVVMIKDPFTWLSSMCRNPYNWLEGRHYLEDGTQCPNLVENDEPVPVNVIYSMRKDRAQRPDMKFDSLVHMYNQWYSEWHDAKFPRLIVRYEDLLLHPEEITNRVCTCAGGHWSPNHPFELVSQKAKKYGTGLEGALARYGNATKRIEDFTTANLEFAKRHLDQKLFKKFHYFLP
uniref:Sulfotransferase domain-containing protein n=1 Tax=Corethron hystrix TaxID=216773 RepID=A0A7S1C2K0_9STRA|mmetsp:Transcript_9790/g.21814  ORF Transcript_9790/g.21814 Transcript_9790/m.21814 type:complete len:369 (+) Transcript_9790:195-1301(+)